MSVLSVKALKKNTLSIGFGRKIQLSFNPGWTNYPQSELCMGMKL